MRAFKNKFRRRGRIVMRDRVAVYHVICRTALQSFILDAEAKRVFLQILHKQARFAGVKVLAYCLMDNHVHLLVRVPPSPLRENGEHLLSDAEILRRYTAFYGKDTVPVSTYSVAELKAVLAQGGEAAEVARRVVLARMGDLSAFMRELKQRFVIWYNGSGGNVGTVWSARFKSLVVENSAEVLTRVAAYIDLNPIRAGIVDDPGAYEWSSYAAVVRGETVARSGFRSIFPGDKGEVNEFLRAYQRILYGVGYARGKRKLKSLSPAHSANGAGDEANPLYQRLGQMCRGIALGSRHFVEKFMGKDAARDGERKYERHAHQLAGEGLEPIYCSRRR